MGDDMLTMPFITSTRLTRPTRASASFMSLALVVYALVVAAIVHTFVVVYEEPTLTDQFGASYVAYREQVRRWIPRPPRG